MSKNKWLAVMLVVQIVAIRVWALFPESVEAVYSNAFYPPVARAFRTVLAYVPFSVGDVVYSVLIVLIVRWFWTRRKTWRAQWKAHLWSMAAVLSIFYFCFNVLWAMNYHRVALADKLGMGRDYTEQELLAFTQRLIERTNAAQLAITHDPSLKVVSPYTKQQIFVLNDAAYESLSKTDPAYRYDALCVKPSLFSLPLTYMGFAGYLNPFTGEAQVNDKIPLFTFPTTAAHEMAHQIGYASESEANFVGYLATIHSDDLYLQYSGYAYALRYCLRSIRIKDEQQFKRIMPLVNPGIRQNYEDAERFWMQYETFIETGFKVFYDNFLKLNRQKDGLENYSKFVDLMVNYYRTRSI